MTTAHHRRDYQVRIEKQGMPDTGVEPKLLRGRREGSSPRLTPVGLCPLTSSTPGATRCNPGPRRNFVPGNSFFTMSDTLCAIDRTEGQGHLTNVFNTWLCASIVSLHLVLSALALSWSIAVQRATPLPLGGTHCGRKLLVL